MTVAGTVPIFLADSQTKSDAIPGFFGKLNDSPGFELRREQIS